MTSHLLKSLEEFCRAVRGKRLSLFLDYDGTLAPIAGRPERALLSDGMKETLKTLSAACPTAVISGRGLEDIKGLVAISGVVYSGNHGMEVWSEDFSMVFDTGAAAKKEISRLKSALEGLASRHRGVLVEDKGLTLSVHYRLLDAPEKGSFLEGLRDAAGRFAGSGLVRFVETKKAFEVRPDVRWNKGSAVGWILGRKRFFGTTPLYIGDDETDKDAFAYIRGAGLSVFVGGPSPEADYYLNFQEEVKPFLDWLLEKKRTTPAG